MGQPTVHQGKLDVDIQFLVAVVTWLDRRLLSFASWPFQRITMLYLTFLITVKSIWSLAAGCRAPYTNHGRHCLYSQLIAVKWSIYTLDGFLHLWRFLANISITLLNHSKHLLSFVFDTECRSVIGVNSNPRWLSTVLSRPYKAYHQTAVVFTVST